jgi:hypothetical protein
VKTPGSLKSWKAVASDSTGDKLVAVVNPGNIWTSIDSGANWTERTSAPLPTNAAWGSVASNAAGDKLVAVVEGGQIYTSINSGANWTARYSSLPWRDVASNAAGDKLVAVATGGNSIYTSTDSGATWTPTTTNRNWTSVASDSTGDRLLASINGGQIYIGTINYIEIANSIAVSGRSILSGLVTAPAGIIGATGSFNNISTNVISFPNNNVQINGLLGQTNQGLNAVAIGSLAGQTGQGSGAVAIGFQAGQTGQGINSIAIGNNAGLTGQTAGCIQINATGSNFVHPATDSCIITPIRTLAQVEADNTLPLIYNTTTREVQYSNQPDIDVNLNTTVTLNNNAYNRFIYISSSTSGNTLNLITPSVTFPASITIFNASANTATISTISNGLRIGATLTSSTNLLADTGITLQTTGSVWVRTATI